MKSEKDLRDSVTRPPPPLAPPPYKQYNAGSNQTCFLQDEEALSSASEELSKHLIKLQEIHSRCSQLPPEVWEKLKSMKTLLDTMVKSN